MDEFNLYSAPEAAISAAEVVREVEEGQGVWRDGKNLVMSRYALLPSRCLRCNEPATRRPERTITWHHPAYFALWLLGPLGWIAYLIGGICEVQDVTDSTIAGGSPEWRLSIVSQSSSLIA